MGKFLFEKKVYIEVEADDIQEAIENICEIVNDMVYDETEVIENDSWGEDNYSNLALKTSDFVE